jgi:hypothetical protein
MQTPSKLKCASKHSLSPALLIAGSIAALGFAAPATASENGANNWVNGGFDVLAGETAPPKPNGTFILSSTVYSHASKITDGLGNDAAFPINPKIEIAGTAVLIDHRWGDTIPWLGNAKLASFAIIPIVHAKLDATLPIPNPPGSPTPFSLVRLHDKATSLGDITVAPILLGWQSGRLHYSLGADVSIPTGKYDAGRLANTGFNYWTIRPAASFSYFGKGGTEVSVRFMYDINFKNNATNYKSGDAFHADFAAGQRLGLAVIGASGYYFHQLGNDTKNGVAVPNLDGRGVGNKGRVFALGPFFRYQFNSFGMTAKATREWSSRYRSQGTSFTLNIDFIL